MIIVGFTIRMVLVHTDREKAFFDLYRAKELPCQRLPYRCNNLLQIILKNIFQAGFIQ